MSRYSQRWVGWAQWDCSNSTGGKRGIHTRALGRLPELPSGCDCALADPNIQNRLGQTPLHLAAGVPVRAGWRLDPLLRAGARKEVADRSGQVPHHLVAKFAEHDVLRANFDYPGRPAAPKLRNLDNECRACIYRRNTLQFAPVEHRS